MKPNSSKELKRYYKEIKRNLKLVYSNVQTAEMMNSIKADINEYIDENKTTDIQNIKEEFGEPIDFITDSLTRDEIYRLSKKSHTSRYIKIGVAVVVILALVASIYFCTLWYLGYLEAKAAIVTQEVTIIE